MKFNSWSIVYSAILVLVSIIVQNVVLTADKVEFLLRRVSSFPRHEILTSTGNQVVLASNQVLLTISVSIFPVDGTFAIKIVPFYFINYNETQLDYTTKTTKFNF